jgi:hypothetical protein
MPGRIVPEPPQPDDDPEHLAEAGELARSAHLAGLAVQRAADLGRLVGGQKPDGYTLDQLDHLASTLKGWGDPHGLRDWRHRPAGRADRPPVDRHLQPGRRDASLAPAAPRHPGGGVSTMAKSLTYSRMNVVDGQASRYHVVRQPEDVAIGWVAQYRGRGPGSRPHWIAFLYRRDERGFLLRDGDGEIALFASRDAATAALSSARLADARRRPGRAHRRA